MKNLRNKNQPVNADLVQVYLQSSWDIVTAVYAELDNIQIIADQISGPGLNFLAPTDIDTLVELNAILTDATLGDAADFATAAQGAKVDFLTVTQPVDLDQLESRVNALDAAVVLKGQWDASSGVFPGGGTAQAGDSWIVSVAGTMDSVQFSIDDRIIAILDNASTTTFAGNWHKADYSDLVTSVAGLTGAITASGLRTAINVEDGATADQTGAEIKTLYEAELDTNAFTDALLSKLTGIEPSATADQTDNEIKTAYENLTTLVSQAEAEAGVATTVRLWTAERVGQAIAALGGGGGGMTVTSVKTGNYTASANEVVPVDSIGGSFIITMPASMTAGQRVIILDVGKYCGVNPVTLGRNSQTFDGAAQDFTLDQSHGRVDALADGLGDIRLHLTGTPEIVNVNDFATGFSGVNAQTGTSYGFVDADLVWLVTANNAAASAYTIPDGLGQIGETLNLLNIGAGTVTVSVPGTDTLGSTANDVVQGKGVTIVKIAATTWYVVGGA